MTDFPKLLKEAFEEANAAANQLIKDNPDQWYPCGFAWVNIFPARGPLVKYLKENNIGRKSFSGGWDISNPAGVTSQWMDAAFVGARAFADKLNAAGFRVTVKRQID